MNKISILVIISTIFVNAIKLNGQICSNNLINYWSFTGANIRDTIGTSHLYGGNNYELTNDRFGNPNSALRLRTGYVNIPPGTYSLGGNFTMMGWVNIQKKNYYQELFDFANGNSDAIMLSLSEYSNGNPYSCMYDGQNLGNNQLIYNCVKSTFSLPLNEWIHLALVFDFPQVSIYINGQLNAFGKTTKYNSNKIRSNNYIGRSYAQGVSDADAIVDELKIFNIGLTQSQIVSEMNQATCKKAVSHTEKCTVSNYCYGYGDPHYITFDNYKFNIENQCSYTLFTSNGKVQYKVLVDHQFIENSNNQTSHIKKILINYNKIDFEISDIVKLNKNEIKIPYYNDDEYIMIIKNGTYIVFDTPQFNLEFDGIQFLKLRNCETTAIVSGICGNNNKNPNDDSNINAYIIENKAKNCLANS